MVTTEQKRCAECHEVFDCGARTDSCWCAALPVMSSPVPNVGCFCPRCFQIRLEKADKTKDSEEAIVEGVDYYLEGDRVVFTSRYLLRRGYCCESGCRHCPYGFNAAKRDVD